ncbi:hypothetical protein IT072_20960 (plasmid) [Leifsonia sp. ZF2019]|uniref:hypothetical protein n=1 Tax=Leifsonia sp. ZF2019 TaxID=2781978 RepID=UPI001CC0758B|nr:hypothetical protein [Leifsonia sp. ZF2019]UAJ81730.1 hypothetical protein IT072_20960 [Leifsonia sp. ZF2019]
MQPAKARVLRVTAVMGLLLALAGCTSSNIDTGGAPPQDSASQLVPKLLRALESGNSGSVEKLVPGSRADDVTAVMAACAYLDGHASHTSLDEPNGPQAVLVIAYSDLKGSDPCRWWMYWDQDRRSWTIGAVTTPSPTPQETTAR